MKKNKIKIKIKANKDGNVLNLTVDHKPQNEKEKERIEKNGGFVENNRVNGKLAMSRSFGDLQYKDNQNFTDKIVSTIPDITTFNLKEEKIKYFLLSSDGLFDHLKSEQVIKFISRRIDQSDPLPSILKELIEFSKNEGSQDNHTIILIKCNLK